MLLNNKKKTRVNVNYYRSSLKIIQYFFIVEDICSRYWDSFQSSLRTGSFLQIFRIIKGGGLLQAVLKV